MARQVEANDEMVEGQGRILVLKAASRLVSPMNHHNRQGEEISPCVSIERSIPDGPGIICSIGARRH